MMSVECVAIFRVVNASSGEKSCLQFSIPTGTGAGGEGGVLHSLNRTYFCIYGHRYLYNYVNSNYSCSDCTK